MLADIKTVVVLGDGQLKMNNNSDTIGALIINGGTVTTGTGKLTLTGDLTASASTVTSTFTGNLGLAAGDHSFAVPDGTASTDLLITGPITGAGGVIKTGAGVMELTGSSSSAFNTYAGQTWIQEGTLNLNTNTSDTGLSTNIKVGDGSGAADSAVLNVMGTFELPDAATLTINADGRVNIAAGIFDDVTTLNINGGELNTDGEFRIRTGGALNSDGTAGSVIDGTGKFALNAANTPFNVADTAAATDLLISARITEFNIGSGFIKQGAGTLEIGGTASNIYTGATSVNGGTLLLNNGSVNGAISHTLNITQGTVKLGQSLEIPDDTTVTLTFGGKFDLNSKAETIGALHLYDNGVSVVTGTATLTLNGDVAVIGTGSASSTITGNIALPADRIFNVQDTPAVQDLVLDGTITGAGGFTLDGGGTLAIVGANDNTPNTYTGTTLIKNGTLFLDDDIMNGSTSKTVIVGDGVGLTGTARLVLNQSSEIPNDASVTIRGDGVWDLQVHADAIGNLTLEGGEIINANTLTLIGDFTSLASPVTAKIGGFLALGSSSHQFTVADGPANLDVQITAVVSGNGGTLVKEGGGQLWLNADETFSNAIVNAGVLHFLGAAATTDVTLNGGTLGGNVSLGKITGTGGIVTPGLEDTATLHAKDLVLGAATYQVDGFDKTGYDTLQVTGGVNLTGSTLALNLSYASSKYDTFKIIDNDGTADAVVGKFINTAADGTFTQNGRTFKVNYNADDGNDVTAANPVLTGVKEFAVGSDVGGGSATLYNPDGSVRYSITPYEAGFTGGIRVAAGDFTGDGIGDLVVASGPGRAGNVRIFDGVTKAQIFDFSPFGDTFTRGIVVTAGDITGDGKAEVVITAERGGGARVRVFSPTGSGMAQTTDFIGLIGGDGVADTSFRGGARAAVGDVNGDGFGDLIFAAGAGGGPRIAIFDGKTLAQSGGPKLRGDFFAFEPSLRDGTYVAAGDFNGDGKAELVAGAGPGGGPRVSIFNGADLVNGTEVKIKDFFAGDVSNRGGIRVTVKNLDNDSKGDLVVGAGPGGGSKVTGYTATEIAKPMSATVLDFDALAGFNGGVYVG